MAKFITKKKRGLMTEDQFIKFIFEFSQKEFDTFVELSKLLIDDELTNDVLQSKEKDFEEFNWEIVFELFSKNLSSEIKHHGVKGMKWGVRKTKGSKIGKMDEKGNVDPRTENIKKKIRQEQKKHDILVSTASLAVVASFIALYIFSNNLDHSFLTHYGVKGMKWGVRKTRYGSSDGTYDKISTARERRMAKLTGEEIDPKNLPKKKIKTSVSQDAKNTNPYYDTKNAMFRMNCPNASLAYELRRRGYDVEAKPLSRGRSLEQLEKEYGRSTNKKFYKATIDDKGADLFSTTLYKKTSKNLSKQPGTRGVIAVKHDWGGHIFNYEVTKSGKVNYIEGQSGEGIFSNTTSPNHPLFMANEIYTYRTDNFKYSDDFIRNGVQKGRLYDS